MTEPSSIPRTGLTLSERRAVLFIGDLAAISLAMLFSLSAWVVLDRAFADPVGFLIDRDAFSPFLWLIPLWFFLIAYLYDPHIAFSPGRTMFGLALAVSVSLLPYLSVYFLAAPGSLPRLAILFFLLAAGALEMGWRLLAIRIFTLPAFQRRVLIVGAGYAGAEIIKVLKKDVPGHFRIAGMIDDDIKKQGLDFSGVKVVGGWESIFEAVRNERVSTIILAITGDVRAEMVKALLEIQESGVEVVRMSALYEDLLGRIPIHHLEADWLLTSFIDSAHLYDLYGPFKRLMDIAGGLVGMFISLVLAPALFVLIRMDSPGPAIYWQERLGKGGRTFRVYKLRTMIENAEADGKPRWASSEDPRITRLGKWLRRTRLDEVPQFWNVLRGEMSLVGPRAERPEIVADLEKQVPFYRARLLVRPGLTGWSQVNFGYVRTVEDTVLKTEYDLYYIRHRSLWLDIKILMRTLGTVLRFQGA